MNEARENAGPVGLVGLGQMGAPMAARLAGSGVSVAGFDISPVVGERLTGTGVTLCGGLLEVARCPIVILVLPDSDAVTQVLVGDGLLRAMDAGTLVLDMSSSVPGRTRELAIEADRHGIELVDAPVSGGVSGAQRGTLTAMVGGRPEAVARARRVLDVLARRVVHVGAVGSGHAMKALNNLMSATHLLVTSEALLAARSFGLDPRVVLDVVNGSSGRSGSTENKWPNFVLPRTFDSGFRLDLMLKDMRIALAVERDAEVFAPLSHAAVALWSEAAQELDPSADHTEIVRWLEARGSGAGVRASDDGYVPPNGIQDMAPGARAD
ncbi:MAG TPA: NAD(P)-dependent oxidoreductase [Jatrophihabitans sp.]|nr:NAD(P)-dependent oxidoreductase [Jatrophihabitans sp.]